MVLQIPTGILWMQYVSFVFISVKMLFFYEWPDQLIVVVVVVIMSSTDQPVYGIQNGEIINRINTLRPRPNSRHL